MKSFANFKGLILFAMLFSLAACGKQFNSALQLPDDPGNEPQSIVAPPTNNTSAGDTTTPVTGSDADRILASYDYVDPTKIIPDRHLKPALLYFDSHKSTIKNTNYLSVIDFSQYSGNKRFYIIDMKTGSVWAIHNAHGKGSDPEHDGYANKTLFSNVSGSNATSLGVYMTAETYQGEHGLTLRLDGLSSTNSNARSRAIVLHGADYVEEANMIQGRSWGCPAVAMENRDKVIGMLKGGSVIYAGGY